MGNCIKLLVAVIVCSAAVFSLSCSYTTRQPVATEKPQKPYEVTEDTQPEIPLQESETNPQELEPSPRDPGITQIPQTPSSVPEETEEDLSLPIIENAKVKRFITYFTGKGRRNFTRTLNRSIPFLPEIKETLREEGVPTDIAYLPLIESAFKVDAVSRRKAVGLWQFIKPTGIRYGLKINDWVDERMDPEKSTVAAARYLKKMHNDFDSWELALAGYNCGEGRVERAIYRTGSRNFWKLSRKLPRETRNYLPQFYAALIIARNPERYGLRTDGTVEKNYETATVPSRKSLAEIASLLGINKKEIYRLNPSLIGLSTPPGGNYELKVPKGYGAKLFEMRNEVASLPNLREPFGIPPVYYRVRPNDNLWKIARRFGTTVTNLKHMNHLSSSSTIHPGQRLRIRHGVSGTYVKHRIRPGETISSIARRYRTSVKAIKQANGMTSSLIIAGRTLNIPQGYGISSPSPRKISHEIKRGDTLGGLARSYRVSVSQIKKWNNLSSDLLIAGKRLLIYK